MIRFPPNPELSVIGVDRPGAPDEERIVLRPTEEINLGYFGIILGREAGEGVQPLVNFFYWFNEITVAPPSWIFVYTGPGEAGWTTTRETGEDALVLHWGMRHTVFDQEKIRPVVFRFGTLEVGGKLQTEQKRIGSREGV